MAAADASLDELEHILLREQWGQVTWFVINRNKEAIYHPLRKYESVRVRRRFILQLFSYSNCTISKVLYNGQLVMCSRRMCSCKRIRSS